MEYMVVGSLLLVIIAAAGWLIGFYNGMMNRKAAVDESWRLLHATIRSRDDLLKNYIEIISDSPSPGLKFLYGAIRDENGGPVGETPCGLMTYSLEISRRIEELTTSGLLYSGEAAGCQNKKLRWLEELEARIESCRQSYNQRVRSYNNFLARFPNRIAGEILGVQRLPELGGVSIGQKNGS